MENGASKELVQATDPVIKCSIHDIIGLKGRGPGQTMQVAMMCRPNNSEDGVVMSQEWRTHDGEAGGHMMVKRLRYKKPLKKTNDVAEVLCNPMDKFSTIEPKLGFTHSVESRISMHFRCPVVKFASDKASDIGVLP